METLLTGILANLKFLPWDEWKTTVSEDEATATWEHISRSPNASIANRVNLHVDHVGPATDGAVFDVPLQRSTRNVQRNRNGFAAGIANVFTSFLHKMPIWD